MTPEELLTTTRSVRRRLDLTRPVPRELILGSQMLSESLNFRDVPEFAADALHGPGVFESLRSIAELVLKRLSGGASAPPPMAAAAR